MTYCLARVERFVDRFLKKVTGRSEVDDVLRRLDELTQVEHRMATSRAMGASYSVRDEIGAVIDGV